MYRIPEARSGGGLRPARPAVAAAARRPEPRPGAVRSSRGLDAPGTRFQRLNVHFSNKTLIFGRAILVFSDFLFKHVHAKKRFNIGHVLLVDGNAFCTNKDYTIEI